MLMISFPSLNIQGEKAKVMFELLSDLTPKQYAKGIQKLCMNQEQIYQGSNIIALIRKYGIVDDLDYLSSVEAWKMVLDEMAHVGGSYGIPKIKNRLVQRAVESLGWREICSSENVDVVRAHFTKAYDSLVARDKESKLTSYNMNSNQDCN